MWAVGVVLLLLASCASHEEAGPSRDRCVQLRDHVVELRLVGLPASDIAKHREAMRSSLGEDFVDHCVQLTASQVKCAFAAKDSTSVADCSSSQ